MNYRFLGKSGLEVSEIAFGTHLTYDAHTSGNCARIEAALELGINLFDTADGYGNGSAEKALGSTLANFDHSDFAVATKCYFPRSQAILNRGLSRKHLFDSVHRSLQRLKLDYIDIFQCHRFDTETPLEETIQALTDLVRSGKVLYWGISRWEQTQIKTAVELSQERNNLPISAQPVLNLFNQSSLNDLPTYTELGIGAIVHSPLAQGVLACRYSNSKSIPSDSRASSQSNREKIWDLSDTNIKKANRLKVFSEARGWTPAQVAISWVLAQEAVSSAIVGSSSVKQLISNTLACKISLSASELAEINDLFQG